MKDRIKHTVYIDCGSIYNSFTESIIERPAILVSKESDTLHGWGNFENVVAQFKKYVTGYSQAGMEDELNDLMFIELSEYKIEREMACYVIRRASEFTQTGFIRNLCQKLNDGSDSIAWLRSEMERIPLDLTEKEWEV